MGSGVESRFERYAEKMIETLGHADRATPARWYLRGLMLPGQRKSVEPMAARVHRQYLRARCHLGDGRAQHVELGSDPFLDAMVLGAMPRRSTPASRRTSMRARPCLYPGRSTRTAAGGRFEGAEALHRVAEGGLLLCAVMSPDLIAPGQRVTVSDPPAFGCGRGLVVLSLIPGSEATTTWGIRDNPDDSRRSSASVSD